MIEEFRAKRLALQKKWEQGLGAGHVLCGLSDIIDEYIENIFHSISVDGVEDVALVALGGYGRREFFPSSDIDLMILYRPKVKKQISKISDSVLYPLWDTGLDVGHGVRTVAESIVHAKEEYFFLVALLDARLICGSKDLFDELVAQYRKKYIDGHRERFVETMKEYRVDRRDRFGSHSYLLEPHIKEGRGGMRDIQAMMWTARVVFGLNGLEDIQGAGLLIEDEKKEFQEARDFLVKLRCGLHFIAKRKNDQLYFEQQSEVALLFGYKDKPHLLAVEQFMRDVYGALQSVTVITDLFFDHVDEVLGFVGKGRTEKDKVIEKGIEVKAGKVHLTASEQDLRARPQTLLRVFLAMSRTGLALHHRSRKLVASHVDIITDKERTSPRLAKTFFTLLIEARDILNVLGTMLETGVLEAVIPEYARINRLAQHDLYHIYTVERHSLQAVAELHEIIQNRQTVVQDVSELKVLYLAALLHDIGKGSGRDHSLEGAEVAAAIGERLCLTKEECEALCFVVRYHLFIPENALRRDLNDTIFIKRCADTIGDLNRLAMLYLLSVADSKATGPSAWSDWKATLMEELYLKVFPHLDHGHYDVSDVDAHEEQGVEWLREQIRLQLKGHKDLKIAYEDLSADYVLTFSPEVIAGHVLTQRDNYQRIRQKSLVVVDKNSDGDGSWRLLVMTVDRPGLLAKIFGVMTLNNLTVSKAQIFTWDDGTVVDVVNVRPIDGLSFAERNWEGLNDHLDLTIEHRMGLSHRLYTKLSSVYGRRAQIVADVSSKVVIDNDASDLYTVIEVYAPDTPGQLYYVTQTMADFGINIFKAYIATEVEQLIDVFYVLDAQGNKLVDDHFCKEITQGILHAIQRQGL
ncbi:[protein-PII] uridylyltransferase [Desulforhopalus sp. IMCC35007]|uniref:[protein-PII] uridylyltransferase n=1 Tax=Desulforhopalus sp. IMCC35007 TaxID=2569543 RepID=UPI0010ADDD86|nr:[protein-PII] uridylyltransferase [Desulforhopalus sp. IMCC35007]TKB12233.1 [protein-PII] uridylyltransferase [Desulforhopalus sp. IMCC35007]